ncbi:MAG: HIT family protein [Candidatus Paracaedibacteraceae bacterium]|nr:HIT family protein [Candidatus Paracaedibacteraceae bacterium]
MKLDPRLENTSSFVCDLSLCQVRLSHNAAFPWILLIPKTEHCIEITDLSSSDQHLLMSEINQASQIMQRIFSPNKLNIATLGNVVPQMHIHIIARYTTDPAWPNPVWNTISKDYSEQDLNLLVQKIKSGFKHILSY